MSARGLPAGSGRVPPCCCCCCCAAGLGAGFQRVLYGRSARGLQRACCSTDPAGTPRRSTHARLGSLLSAPHEDRAHGGRGQRLVPLPPLLLSA